MNAPGHIQSFLFWVKKRPVMTAAALVFHTCFLILPLFLNAHVVLINSVWDINWISLSSEFSMVMTLLAIFSCSIFMIRRLCIRRIRALTRSRDYWMLLIVSLPLLSGFLTHHHFAWYSFWLIIHIISGEVLVALVFLRAGLFASEYIQKRWIKKNYWWTRGAASGLVILLFGTAGLFAKNPVFSWPFNSLQLLVIPYVPEVFHPMIKVHFFILVIILAFIIPADLMRHISASLINMLYFPKSRMAVLSEPGADITAAATMDDLTWKQMMDSQACVSCGKCVEYCPAAISGKPLSPEKVNRSIADQIGSDSKFGPAYLNEIISAGEIWSCTTCMACVHHCPVFTDPVDKIISLRRHETLGLGQPPNHSRGMFRHLELFGDTYGRGPALRMDWVHDEKVPILSDDAAQTDILLWVGCAGAFHPRYSAVYRSMVKILTYARIDFAVMGQAERCCGDQARRLGHETLFSKLAAGNVDEMKKFNFKRVVTLCPHCLHSLKNEYPRFGGEYDVIHASQLVADLINDEKITPKYPFQTTVTFHDPCYLGRVNKTYQPIRTIAGAIEGIKTNELEHNRENGFCCGGGGGQMWLHDNSGQHISHLRALQVAESKACTVATACPYCLTMLDDGLVSIETQPSVQVKDIIEIAASSIG